MKGTLRRYPGQGFFLRFFIRGANFYLAETAVHVQYSIVCGPALFSPHNYDVTEGDCSFCLLHVHMFTVQYILYYGYRNPRILVLKILESQNWVSVHKGLGIKETLHLRIMVFGYPHILRS